MAIAMDSINAQIGICRGDVFTKNTAAISARSVRYHEVTGLTGRAKVEDKEANVPRRRYN